jgi:hypothetical protein
MMVFPTPMLPHMIPLLRLREAGEAIFEKPGNDDADISADAIAALLVNSRLFIVYCFE